MVGLKWKRPAFAIQRQRDQATIIRAGWIVLKRPVVNSAVRRERLRSRRLITVTLKTPLPGS